MYEQLTTHELAVLTRWLFEGAEQAYLVACTGAADGEPDWTRVRQPVHAELASEFFAAAMELMLRLDPYCPQIV